MEPELRKVTILHQCLVFGQVAREGDVIEVSEKDYIALVVAGRIARRETPRGARAKLREILNRYE